MCSGEKQIRENTSVLMGMTLRMICKKNIKKLTRWQQIHVPWIGQIQIIVIVKSSLIFFRIFNYFATPSLLPVTSLNSTKYRAMTRIRNEG